MNINQSSSPQEIEKNKFRINKTVSYLDKCLVYIIRRLNKFHLKLLDKYNIKKWYFKYMIPEKKAKKIDTYEKQFLEALEKKEVKNIAITGDYGAGKSSFLKTFEYKHPEYAFLDISLATFDEKNEDISIIEKSILEQIFYKEQYDKIPQSRFRKIKSYRWINLKTIFIILTIFSILILVKPKYFTQLEIYNKFLKNYYQYLEYISIIVILFVLFFSVKYFIKKFNGFVLNKLNLQNIEIEANNIDDSSLLNKYLDEILYFFEKTDYQVIIFQDLDRFKDSKIFIKLRELNRLINNSKQINKRIVFVYVLKDEIFKNQNERVKFFDVIIPIIPYVNTKTSYDTLLNWFGKEIDKIFLKDISIYIYDMRLLKNIFNEYKVFKLQIGKGLDKTKLLSMIIYKNFYPKDYSKLHKGKSIINKIINKKYEYLEKIRKNILDEIESLKEKINDLKKDLKNNIEVQELRKIYIYEIIRSLELTYSYFYCDNQQINISNAIEDEYFVKINNSNKLSKDRYNNLTFKEIEQKVNPNLTYQEREELILSKTNYKIKHLENEIDNLNKKLESLNLKEMKDIIKELSDDETFEKLLKNKELLKYLLTNGYIGEDYYLYISHEMNNALTLNDIEFLKAIKNNKKLNFDFKINNIDEIIDNLNNNDFYKKSILNTYLIDFIINNNKYNSQRENVFKFLSSDEEIIERFIAYCIDLLDRKIFIPLIVKYNPNTWKIIKKFGNKTSLDSYCGWIFYFAYYQDILKLKDFREYFENKIYMQSFRGEEAQKVIQYIKDNEIKFKNLEQINSIEISSFIFENNCYAINEKMINKMIFLHCAPKSEIEEKLKTAHFTTIKNILFEKKSAEFLLNYINENINDYIKNVFLNIETNTQESEKSIIELLNNKELNEDLKSQIIEKEEAKISNLSEIKDLDLWKVLLEKNKILSTWQNIGEYYNKIGKIDEYLFKFLNNIENAKILSKTKINNEFCEKYNFDSNILDEIIISNKFNLENYKLLLKSNGFGYKNINIENLEQEKIEILIEYGKLQLTKENLDNLKEKNLHIKFILSNINEFFKNIDELFSLLDEKDYIEILRSKIDVDKKLFFIQKIDFENYYEELANIICEIYMKEQIKMNFNLLNNLLNFITNKKFDCLIQQLNLNKELNCEDITKLLNNFDFPYNELCKKDTTRLELNNNNQNKEFLEILKQNQCISSFKVKDKQLIIYRKRK